VRESVGEKHRKKLSQSSDTHAANGWSGHFSDMSTKLAFNWGGGNATPHLSGRVKLPPGMFTGPLIS
jgi:hypothetical protein